MSVIAILNMFSVWILYIQGKPSWVVIFPLIALQVALIEWLDVHYDNVNKMRWHFVLDWSERRNHLAEGLGARDCLT